MPKKAPVEAYKLTPGFKGWMDKFRQLKKAQGFFQNSLQKEKSMLNGMTQKYQQLMQVMQGHVQQMPQLKVKELEGQD